MNQFKSLGTNLLAVSVFQQKTGHSESSGGDMSLTAWRELPLMLPDVMRIAPYNNAYLPVSFQGKNLTASLIGADEALADIVHIQLEKGRFVSYMMSFERLCVIGSALAQQLKQISLHDPLGQQLRVGQLVYTIIGVAAPWKEHVFFNEDINQAVIIPVAGMSLLSKNAKVNNAVMLLRSDSHIDEIIAQIKQVIQIQAPTSNLFIRSAKQIIASMESQGEIFTLMLGAIGSVSLLVGGIGVMNVMLITVTERKKEIGIRKAVGARNREIQYLFLVESMILSLLGGILGVVIGLLFTLGMAYFSHWPFTFYTIPPLVGFSVSVITGVFFGFYPACRAARLEPMGALRSE